MAEPEGDTGKNGGFYAAHALFEQKALKISPEEQFLIKIASHCHNQKRGKKRRGKSAAP